MDSTSAVHVPPLRTSLFVTRYGRHEFRRWSPASTSPVLVPTMGMSERQKRLRLEKKYAEQKRKAESELDPMFLMADEEESPRPTGITRAIWREHLFGRRPPPAVPRPKQTFLRMYIGRYKIVCYVSRTKDGALVQSSTLDEELGPYRGTRSVQAIELMTQFLIQRMEEKYPDYKDIMLTRFSFQNDRVRAAARQKLDIVFTMLVKAGFRIGCDVDDFIVTNKLRRDRIPLETMFERFYFAGCQDLLTNFKVVRPAVFQERARRLAREEFEADDAEQIGTGSLLSSMENCVDDSILDVWDEEEAEYHAIVVAERQAVAEDEEGLERDPDEEEQDEDGWIMEHGQRRTYDATLDEDDDEFEESDYDGDRYLGSRRKFKSELDDDDEDEDEDDDIDEPIDLSEIDLPSGEFSQIDVERGDDFVELVNEDDDTKLGDDFASFFDDDEEEREIEELRKKARRHAR